MKSVWFGLLILLSWLPTAGRAVLTIEITQGIEGAIPIAVIPFATTSGAAPPPERVARIISADLRRSGQFEPLEEENLISQPSAPDEVRFQDWRTLGAESLVIGRVETLGNDQYRVEFRLFDVLRGRQVAGYSLPANESNMRLVAHHISDIIYEELTGRRGAFATRIAYVISDSINGEKEYRLQLADSDGYNPRTLLSSKQPLMSPAWSPDASRLAYVSFEKSKPAIYVQEIRSGQRKVIASYPGINGSPAWSPDGRKLAMTLSRDGNPEIYSIELDSGQIRRLTSSSGIDTEPVWSPDGRSIVFTSDRGGSPQLYTMPSTGGRAQRLTFEGNYNASADYSPDGKTLALVHAESGKYRIATLDLDSGLLRVITDGSLDESPSFAPNGSMIIYATQSGRSGVLAAVSSDGRFRQRLSLQKGDVREPRWSPMDRSR